MRLAGIFELLLRLAWGGGVFLYAGLLKAQSPHVFADNVRTFQMVDDPWPAVIALGLPWLEIFVGAAVVVRRLYAGALLIGNGALVVFLYAIYSAWSRGLDITCGCFGAPVNQTDYNELIARDLVLLAAGIILVILAWMLRRGEPRFGGLVRGPRTTGD